MLSTFRLREEIVAGDAALDQLLEAAVAPTISAMPAPNLASGKQAVAPKRFPISVSEDTALTQMALSATQAAFRGPQ